MHINPAYSLFSKALKDALSNLNLTESIQEIEKQISLCPYPEKGQLTFKTFKYASTLRKSPNEIAQEIKSKIEGRGGILSAQTEGAYINVYIDQNELAQSLHKQIDTGSNSIIYPGKLSDEKVLVEYSQPNTHKELHIGHARNAVLGDTLCNLLRYTGHNVYSENYHGDEGAHVAKCIWHMHKNNLQPSQEEDKGTWLGKIYKDATTALSEAKGSEKEIEFQAEISEVLKQIEGRDGEFYEIWKDTRQWSIELFEDTYEWLGANFDNWTCESDVSELSFKIVDEYYKKETFVKSEGAIGVDLSEQDLGFCLLLKSDGRGLYATKDIALAIKRCETIKPDRCIYIVDNRQSFHFQQIFASLEVMDLDIAQKCQHLAYELVETKDGAMSSRHGTIVPFSQLVKNLENTCQKAILERSASDEESIEKKARNIAKAAIRYGMIRIDPDSKIIFDMEDWLRLEGKTGPYLLYSYVRMNSILNKVTSDMIVKNVDWNLLNNTHEQHFLILLSQFNQIIEESVKKYKPNVFANYIFDLAQTYSSMYNESPVLNENDKDIRNARIALTQIGSKYLKDGLNLLGIDTVEKM